MGCEKPQVRKKQLANSRVSAANGVTGRKLLPSPRERSPTLPTLLNRSKSAGRAGHFRSPSPKHRERLAVGRAGSLLLHLFGGLSSITPGHQLHTIPQPHPNSPLLLRIKRGFCFLLRCLSWGPQNRFPFGQGLLTLPGEKKLGQVNHRWCHESSFPNGSPDGGWGGEDAENSTGC